MWPTSMCSPTRHPCRISSRKCFFRPLHLVARNVVLPFVIVVVNPMFSSEVEVEEKLSYSFFSVVSTPQCSGNDFLVYFPSYQPIAVVRKLS